MSDVRIGAGIRRRRQGLGMSQAAFAQELRAAGLARASHQTWASRLEKGEQALRLTDAVIVAETLGCTLDDLVGAGEAAQPDNVRLGVEMSIRALTDLMGKL